MEDQGRVEDVFFHILGKAEILEDGSAHMVSESILIGHVKDKSAESNARSKAQAIIIIRVSLGRCWIIENPAAQGNDIICADDKIFGADAHLMGRVNVRGIDGQAAYGGGFVSTGIFEGEVFPFSPEQIGRNRE